MVLALSNTIQYLFVGFLANFTRLFRNELLTTLRVLAAILADHLCATVCDVIVNLILVVGGFADLKKLLKKS